VQFVQSIRLITGIALFYLSEEFLWPFRPTRATRCTNYMYTLKSRLAMHNVTHFAVPRLKQNILA